MIGERLLKLRKDAGLTQENLAEVLKLSKFSISAYECDRNEPSSETTVKMAKFFNVTVDYLLGISDDPKPYELQQKYIRIPQLLPTTAERELVYFMDYLIYKYTKRRIK